MKSKKSLLVSAAVSALMLTGCPESGQTAKPPTDASKPADAAVGSAAPAAADKHACKGLAADGKNECASPEYKHGCKGQNACKGQGGCGGNFGKNDCKGKGGCAVPKMH